MIDILLSVQPQLIILLINSVIFEFPYSVSF